MIRDQWYVVLRSKELPRGKTLGVTRLGEKMVFWRESSGQPVCQVDQCPHRGAALSAGRLVDDHVQCPFHGFEFDGSGRCRYIPANGKASQTPRAMQVRTYAAREAHGYIYIWWGEERQEYPALPWFDDLDSSFSTIDLIDHWSVHYSRAIENQLDVFHLPFVHNSTIGRGNFTISDGPLVVLQDDLMQIWIFNRTDDGNTVSRRISELPPLQGEPFLKFMFPHLWMNRISNDVRITVFFTPIDEENCLLYLRSYQRFMRLPILRTIFTWFFNPSNRIILNQDKRVVLTQRPLKSALYMDEKLIPQDGPIIEYRRVRRALQQQARQPVERAVG